MSKHRRPLPSLLDHFILRRSKSLSRDEHICALNRRGPAHYHCEPRYTGFVLCRFFPRYLSYEPDYSKQPSVAPQILVGYPVNALDRWQGEPRRIHKYCASVGAVPKQAPGQHF